MVVMTLQRFNRVTACQLEGQSTAPRGSRIGLAVSIGVANYLSDADIGTRLLEEAILALHAAKAVGRNRVACSTATSDCIPETANGSPRQQPRRALIRGGSRHETFRIFNRTDAV
jgi:hypothetical protein